MKTIMFVCTGNTCRSPMAEGIANNLINNNKNLRGNFIAKSSGISVYNNQKANPLAIETLKDGWSLDISKHKSNSIQSILDDEIFLILTMTVSHSNYLKNIYPMHSDIIYTLREYISLHNSLNYSNLDIIDPFGMDKQYYQNCAKELHQLISKLISILDNKPD